jgi:hypothetical protein
VSLRICSRDMRYHLLSADPAVAVALRATCAFRVAKRLQALRRLWRRGQESNLPRLLRTDDGFEDREGHQAPFTLPRQRENTEHRTPNIEHPTAEAATNSTFGVRRSAFDVCFNRCESSALRPERPAPAGRLATRKKRRDRLLELFNRADDGVEIRPVAGLKFGVKEFSMGANFESAAARRDERERFDTLAEFENFCRQTDGFRRVVSNHAVFDRYFGFHLKTPFRGEGYRRSEMRSRE